MEKKINFLSILSKYLFLFFFLFLVSLSFLLTLKFSQSFHFVDEDDHLVIGYFLNQNLKLYRDISTNHQPLVYFLAAISQKIFFPQNLYQLLQISRFFLFFYFLIWFTYLSFSFGWPLLVSLFLYEAFKYFIFGYHLLAESLAMPPFIYILSLNFRSFFFDKKNKKSDFFLFGLANFLVLFNLLPLLPSLLILDLLFLYSLLKEKKQFYKKVKLIILGFFIPLLVLFFFISPLEWFKETIINNWKYAIPQISPFKTKEEMLKILFFPFSYFWQKDNFVFNHFIRCLTCFFSFNLVFSFFNKNKNQIFCWFFLVLAVFISNNRIIGPQGTVFYGAFHLIPWFAAFLLFNIYSFIFLLKKINSKIIITFFFALFLPFIKILSSPQMPYFIKIFKDREHNANFYRYHLLIQALKAISKKGDKLAVIPDEVILYWQSGADLASRQVVYYEWQYSVPELKKSFDEMLTFNQPEFIYADFKRIGPASYLKILEETLARDYFEVTRGGINQNLYIKKEKIKKINENQWQEWQKLSFDKIFL